MLSTQGGDIDQMVESERLAIVKIFLILAGVMVVLSVLFAGTIASPVRRLAEGAERVRRRIRARVEIPDFTHRRDEIGHLSGTLREMTSALYRRIEHTLIDESIVLPLFHDVDYRIAHPRVRGVELGHGDAKQHRRDHELE